ncbi:MAG: GNAT family N-acetyltransferase [candidate division Zixibacteria bacterium]|nr:GNAT family N-acetyltransferase [candidate division Zixibacteria bacterium]
MAELSIHKAVEADIETLCRLYYEFHEYHVDGVPDRLISLGPFDKYDSSKLITELKKILDDDNADILIAESDNRAVGLVEIYLREDEPDPQRVAYRYGHLQSLYVLQKFRGRGFGSRLVTAAEKWVRDKGGSEIQLDTWEFEGDPVVFYEHCGYRTVRRKMVRKL